MNETLTRFGFPVTAVKEYEHWVALVRPEQVTLGSLVLGCKADARSLSALPRAAFAELADATYEIEAVLRRAVGYDKINWLALMMRDPQVHFHVFPRYATPRALAGLEIADAGWPGRPLMEQPTVLDRHQVEALRTDLEAVWRSIPPRG